MSVKITDICIACGACIDECPVEAIVDDDDNPNADAGIYYVYGDKCVECVSHHDEPACATACPTEGCIVWGEIVGDQPHRDGVKRDGSQAVVE
ncbi:ferredoxin [Helicobacter monodelphidis]|uniref:4Fe-4S dicluster domain-containing protein n=1 Tax=Helicobacter sp. 15-1451 TaxID=2004995 RepID=UPI000DCEEC4F|nr:4Fe-4S dicluster domain-containing protein [Helicobacter sp. 15-1451]RAX58038.1 ferredoxin [Helicobacter sp. 15-1451]